MATRAGRILLICEDSLEDAHSKYFSLTITYERVKDTPAKLSYYTGIPNGYTFEALWSFLSVTEDGINGDDAKSGESRKRSRGEECLQLRNCPLREVHSIWGILVVHYQNFRADHQQNQDCRRRNDAG